MIDFYTTDEAVILAGGKSRRLGSPKALIEIHGRPLLSKIAAKLLAAGIPKIFLSTNEPEAYREFELECVEDEFKGKGPLAGIHAALKRTESYTLFFISCDLPNITIDAIEIMLKAADSEPKKVVYASTPKKSHHLFGIINRSVLTELTEALENDKLSVQDFFESTASRAVRFDDEDLFLNINTREDLEKLQP
ncbi:MAG TPA: molybdenum cofactor guanylyltransferase [bacterium]|jgi:molybdopterin-guanine dinucleotide biosynthesis protein A